MCDWLCIDIRILEHRRSFDYYNRSRCLATAFSFRKWFPPDGSRQSERISTWFPRTVRARTFAFRATAVHSAFAVVRSLKRNAKRKFRKKNEYVDKGKFTGSGKPSALFLSSLFAALRCSESARDSANVKLHRYLPRQCEASYFIGAERSMCGLNRVKTIFVALYISESTWQFQRKRVFPN